MPSDADIRSVLREHGVTVPPRGKLGPKHRETYDRIQAGVVPEADDDWDGPDDEGDIITATIPGPAAAPPADQDDDERGRPIDEARPRVRPGKGGTARRLADRVRAKSSSSGKGKSRPRARIPVDRLISRGWGMGARLVAPVSGATARTLMLQAPVAGLVLEDTVRGTAADTVLQYAARAEDAGERVFALVGPPLIVMAIERAQGLEEPARQMRLAILIPLLEEALTMWCQIAGDKMEVAAARMAETAAVSEEVNRLIALIFPQAEVEDQEQAETMAGAPA